MKESEKRSAKYAYHGYETENPEVAHALLYHFFAERYGWTPEQVDRTPHKTLLYLIELAREANESENISNRLMKKVMG